MHVWGLSFGVLVNGGPGQFPEFPPHSQSFSISHQFHTSLAGPQEAIRQPEVCLRLLLYLVGGRGGGEHEK